MTTRQKVTFAAANGAALTGNLFLPDTGAPAPGVVVAGTWTSVKELMADRYAERLAGEGYAALSFDFTGYGESGGEPRDYESPELKIADIGDAVTFLDGHPGVDATRIGALGVCAAAMYMSASAVADQRIRSLALIAPWLHDAKICREVYGGAEGVGSKIEEAANARARYEATGERHRPHPDRAQPGRRHPRRRAPLPRRSDRPQGHPLDNRHPVRLLRPGTERHHLGPSGRPALRHNVMTPRRPAPRTGMVTPRPRPSGR